MQQHVHAYQRSQSLTARPGDLLLSLFDGALRFSAEAHEAIERKDYDGKGRAVGRTLAILNELTQSLDDKHSPSLCNELANLYNYLERRLHLAGSEMRSAPVQEVIAHLTLLKRTWSEAVDKARLEGHRV